ncbi:MAG: oligosaccharide flippase family protein [Betaproteobacteria bacterium]|nr:oligosaccharide flippase family protein [Betaproteobacteria bacterium]
MTAATKSLPLHGLKRRALSLGAAKAFDYAMQFLLPVVLVRCLDKATFGEYRLLWLAISTLMYLATFNMPQSLYLFLPRSDARTKRLYLNQTFVFLAASGLACAWLVSPWNPWLPSAIAPLGNYGPLVPAFVALWLVAYMVDLVPTIDERIAWQSVASIGLSILRVMLLAAGAFFTGSMEVLLWLLLAFVVFKIGVLAYYVGRFHGIEPILDGALFRRQVAIATPLGFSNALYGLRWQGDQWIAAYFFSLTSFAAFSVAAVLGPLVNVFRASVNEAFLPSMSRLQAAGDARGMAELNSRANVMVGTLLYPMLAFCFLFAHEIVTVVYTSAYLEAVGPMRLYTLAFAAMVVEVGSIILLLEEGRFALRVNMLAIAVSLLGSLAGALHIGLTGAAAGSVAAIYLDRMLTLRRISRRTGIPVRRLQDWRGLGAALVYGAVAALAAWLVVQAYAEEAPALVRLVIGGAVLSASYGLALVFLKKRRA